MTKQEFEVWMTECATADGVVKGDITSVMAFLVKYRKRLTWNQRRKFLAFWLPRRTQSVTPQSGTALDSTEG